MLIAPVAHWLRMWDRMAADRVDHFVAISNEVSGRIAHHYRRDSEVIYPPVDVERVRPNGRPPEDFLLVVSALVGYKRVDLAIEAANRLRRRLVVVGDGPQRARLQALAGPTVEFRGRLDDAEIADLYARCRAFVFPGLEDFGITPVEAQAAGSPVILTDFSAQTELCGAGWLIEVDPMDRYLTPQYSEQAWVGAGAILEALDAAYEARGDEAQRTKAREFALQYDARRVWERDMKPALTAAVVRLSVRRP